MKLSSPFNRRKKLIRSKIKKNYIDRLTVYKSLKHIYAQVFCKDSYKVLVSASSVEKVFKLSDLKKTKKDVSSDVGLLLAKRMFDKNITKVAFDRSGFKFHGRIKSLAESVRSSGIKF